MSASWIIEWNVNGLSLLCNKGHLEKGAIWMFQSLSSPLHRNVIHKAIAAEKRSKMSFMFQFTGKRISLDKQSEKADSHMIKIQFKSLIVLNQV